MPDPVIANRIPLSDLAVLRFAGADAVAFLQGQLSNDVGTLAPTHACLAAWCSAKGRVLATLVVWREAAEAGDRCYALVQADVAVALVKRLSLFVLRAKVTVEVAALRVVGEVLAETAGDGAAWDLLRTGDTVRIQTPSSANAPRRYWCIEAAEGAPGLAADANSATVAASDASVQAWRAADIAAGLPWIGSANQDVYIPQTLNLDVLGAISFTKGCYPGQEVVARSHYRGTIKRRMVYASAVTRTPPAIGTDVFKEGDANPCGRVINQACVNGVQHLLLEVQLADLPNAYFYLDAAGANRVTLQRLPYDV